MLRATTSLSILLALASAQHIGTAIKEVPLSFPSWKCTKSSSGKSKCVKQSTKLVIDAFHRNLHKVGATSTSCYTNGSLDPTLCPDAATCAKNCALEGVDYAAAGMKVDGQGSVTLSQQVKNADGTWTTVSPRAYLLAADGKNYVDLKMLNQELSFDVDISQLVCGMNGAIYFSEMEANGGRSSLNPAGAAYGTGYCDAQCPQLSFINGEANVGGQYGACCNEMDLFEANARAQAYTPHACGISSVYKGDCANTDECTQETGVCDKWGCAFNPYSQHPDFYGLSKLVDTTKKFTVTTQFITDTGTSSGNLAEIRRLYVQGGKIISNAAITYGDPQASTTSLTNPYCTSTSSWFTQRGGLTAMGQALQRGMVLVMSIWWDVGGYMNWLDTGSSGPCNETEGNPELINAQHPDVSVTVSNVRYGDLGTTYSGTV
ncbi:glycoside hydrolase family 7 protein [Auriculariales sp. MPI-PUGE-AT-0066]|nr:glycoside hydrolase family 7 protein [Auriculariales sp. MPI-PUGE-AT-0066]